MSCSRLGSNGAVYETILATDPDLFLVPGDFFYADHMTTAAHFTEAFDETLTQPAQAALLAAVPIGYVWDDHDYGGNDADGTSPTRDLARDAFSTYVPHYPLTADTINQASSDLGSKHPQVIRKNRAFIAQLLTQHGFDPKWRIARR